VIIKKAFKYRLKVNAEIERQLVNFSGINRYVWNQALGLQSRRMQREKTCRKLLTYNMLAWLLTLWKQSNERSFLNEAPSQTLQQTLKTLDRAFKDCFDKRQPNKRFPVFKKKGMRDSFRYPQGFKLNNNQIFLPKIGWVSFFKSRKIEGEAKNVTVSRRGKHWYISIQTQYEVADPIHPSKETVGIDVGISQFASLSSNEHLQGKNATKKYAKILSKYQRRLARKQKFSSNWKKEKSKIGKIHTKVADTRNDRLHWISNKITTTYETIYLEKLPILNMVRSAKGTVESPGKNVSAKSGLNKAILDQGWGEFARQLEYKNKWKGGNVQYVDPKYTSQECRKCHYTSRENRESQSKFLCKQCGHAENADINASYNVKEKGRSGRPSQPAKRISSRGRQQELVGNCEKVPCLS